MQKWTTNGEKCDIFLECELWLIENSLADTIVVFSDGLQVHCQVVSSLILLWTLITVFYSSP